MTDKSAAAIDGDYSNFQLVQSRKVCRIVIEFPIERADEVVRLLGWPKPHSTTRCAVALLTDNARAAGHAAGNMHTEVNGIGGAKAGSNPAPGPNSVPLLAQGKAAGDAPTREDGVGEPVSTSPAAPSPRKWENVPLSEQASIRCRDQKFWRYLGVSSHDDAVIAIRDKCLVISRVSILPGTVAGQTWLAIDRDYQAWQRAPAMGADQ